MKVINDTPKGTSKIEEHTDIVSYMEKKYPKMTSEFKKILDTYTILFVYSVI